MFGPDYEIHTSLAEKMYKLQGNGKVASELIDFVRENYLNTYDLYTAQDMMKAHCISEYGEEFYERSKESIAFIVENEYCNKERDENFVLDKAKYEYDMKHGVLY